MEPQRKNEFSAFSLNIWHLVASNLLIFLWESIVHSVCQIIGLAAARSAGPVPTPVLKEFLKIVFFVFVCLGLGLEGQVLGLAPKCLFPSLWGAGTGFSPSSLIMFLLQFAYFCYILHTDNARNNARCTQARKTTHGLDGQHQDVDRTLRGRVNQNDRDKWRKYVHGVANRRIEDG